MNPSYAERLEADIRRLSETGQVLVHGWSEIALRLLDVRDRGGCFTTAPGADERQRRFRLPQADCESDLLRPFIGTHGLSISGRAKQACVAARRALIRRLAGAALSNRLCHGHRAAVGQQAFKVYLDALAVAIR